MAKEHFAECDCPTHIAAYDEGWQFECSCGFEGPMTKVRDEPYQHSATHSVTCSGLPNNG